ncbi:FGGY-family carbohydrate kinase [Micromonospora sp. NPDC048930]|uniref:FGGY-family carbohydrate kinase n=1 Tax=Micromonospora sp. NPDC048930 TaxID=3364261 RepID=UPI003714405C
MPREGDVWVGIDVGTQSAHTVAVTSSGAVLGRARSALTSRRVGDRHEQDPQQWWTAVTRATRHALAGVPPGAVRGVAVAGTSGTVVLLGPMGTPVTPGIMYDDARATTEVARVNEAGGPLWAELGYQRMQPTWALPKLLWLLRHVPHPPAGLALAHQSDVINRRLVGRAVATDLSSALKTGADLVAGTWPRAVFDALGVPPDLLPPLVTPGTRLGAVCAAAADETGLPAGTPVHAGMTDGCAAQLASGALRPGSWNSVLGTTLVLKGVADRPLRDPTGAVYSHRGPGGTWLPGGASSTGAGVIARDYPPADLPALTRAAGSYEPAAPVCYPLLSAGERFPFVAPQARGFVVGTPRDEAERFAAVLQGVAYLERLCFDHLDLLGAPLHGEVVLAGGATRNSYWNQLRADILDRPVLLPDDVEPALGMAILAAAADRDLTATAATMVRIRTVIEPRPGAPERFLPGYLRLVDTLERLGWLPAATATHARKRSTG